ncbi:ABC transporter substrate-binding protein [Microvirga arabica]|uniref:ABC transporter substrate-binding protein n=1 Tax=Microvirga arabica TaxID=1128671 RepID=UPI0019395BC1|nr:ABC transporter substrate-binding protein [Microvirga arabica]MBM1173564.1 ABC transporter substrate-binding protein [Microvirga arabica]
MLKTIAAGFTIATAILAPLHSSQAQTKVNISYQPALYWALPFYLASEKGWWKEIGLEPSFSLFPAGAPQVAAAQAGSWDMGATGSVPAVLGAARSGLLTIGISNDESKTNVLMTLADKFNELQADPTKIKGQKILLTTNSTGDYAVRNCLKKYGVDTKDVQFVNLGQAQIISAISSKNGELAGVWAPNTYTLEEKANAKTLCTGADAGAIVPGALIVRADYAKENPQRVAAFLATYLRGWSWAKANPTEAADAMKRFYSQGGVEISDRAIKQEFDLRPTYNLTEQLKSMDRANGASEADKWFGNIASFMAEAGTFPRAPDMKTVITDEYMKMVASDPKLKAFATEFDSKTQ